MERTRVTAGPISSKYRVMIPRAGTPDELRNLRDTLLEKRIRDVMSPANDGVHVHIDVIAGYVYCDLSSRSIQWSLQFFGAQAGSWLWLSVGNLGFVLPEEVLWFVNKWNWKIWDTDMSMGRKNMRYLVTNMGANLVKERKK